MDGGGRLLRPLAAGLAAGADGRAIDSFTWSTPRARSFSFFQPRRRSAARLHRRIPRHAGTLLTLAFFAATGAYGMVLGGQYQWLREQYGEPRHAVARLLGFGIDRVTISGLSQLEPAEVLRAAGITSKVSLPFLSAAETRARLEEVPAVRSAAVRKLYPDELSVTLVERQPFALWQRNGDLFIVAADGTVIDHFQDASLAGLPLVVGDGANARAADYLALLEAAGPLKPRIRAGMLVSGRRWTLKMDNGMDVRLPEIDAPAAVARLARLERDQKILEKDVLALDLRMNDRIVVRLSEEASAARAEIVKKRPGRGGKGLET
jgi:cell division protein FtsQ